jgi:hypothetical protein
MVLLRTSVVQMNSGLDGEDLNHSCRILPNALRTSATVMSCTADAGADVAVAAHCMGSIDIQWKFAVVALDDRG